MERFLASFIISVILLCGFVYGVRQSALENGQGVVALRFNDEDRSIDFKPSDKEMVSGDPFLVDAIITDEQADLLEMEFRYIVNPGDNSTYWISFSPPSSDFDNLKVSLKQGPNSLRLATNFVPKVKFKRIHNGTRLNFYIYKKVSETQEIQVFSRRAVFEKRWRKPRRLGFYNLRASEFHTK